MNFALSIIALTLVVALICFYPLLRSVKAKEDKKRDELNKALYFSRLQEIEQDNQQGLVENVEQLKQELQKTPKDAKKWWLLGQVGMNLGNGKLAFDSYQQANKLEPDNLTYKLSYARMLMSSEDQTDKLKGNQLLRDVIRQDHSNPEALSLLAFSYFEGEDYKMAAVTWAMMLRLLEPDDPRVPMLEKSIRAARDALALQEEEKAKSVTPEK